jgi:hypothetical protein
VVINDPTRNDGDGPKPAEKKDGDAEKPLAKTDEGDAGDGPGLTIDFILPKKDSEGPGEPH